jgi:hypothetical protein
MMAARWEARAIPGDFCYHFADSRCSCADQSCTSCVDRDSLTKHERTNRDKAVEEASAWGSKGCLDRSTPLNLDCG